MKVGKPTARRRGPQRSQPGQLVLFKKRGGNRRGAGRKPKGRRAGSPHRARPELKARHPVHVVLRVIGAVGNLRRRFTYHAIREATLTTARREDFRIVHVSIQRTHVHLLVEANDKRRARLNCMAHLLQQIPYEEVAQETVELPERRFNPDYERHELPPELFVPRLYG